MSCLPGNTSVKVSPDLYLELILSTHVLWIMKQTRIYNISDSGIPDDRLYKINVPLFFENIGFIVSF